MARVRKHALRTQQYILISVPDYLAACMHIPRHRLCSCLKALCQATLIDKWDSESGTYDCKAGDEWWTPQNIYEERLWLACREGQKRRYEKYGQGIDRISKYEIE